MSYKLLQAISTAFTFQVGWLLYTYLQDLISISTFMLNTPNDDDSYVWAPTHTSTGDCGVGAADRRTHAVKNCSASELLLQTSACI